MLMQALDPQDLKARYYALCRRLIRSRITTADMDTRQALLATYTFDRARETERKRAVERLFGRTPAQLAEEEALYVEIRRLEQNETRFAAEREDLLRLLGGWERTPNGDRNSTASVGAGLGFAIPGSVPPPEEPSDGKVSPCLALSVASVTASSRFASSARSARPTTATTRRARPRRS